MALLVAISNPPLRKRLLSLLDSLSLPSLCIESHQRLPLFLHPPRGRTILCSDEERDLTAIKSLAARLKAPLILFRSRSGQIDVGASWQILDVNNATLETLLVLIAETQMSSVHEGERYRWESLA